MAIKTIIASRETIEKCLKSIWKILVVWTVIVLRNMRVVITLKQFNPAAIFECIWSQEFQGCLCLVSISPIIYYDVYCVYRSYSFAVRGYNFWASCSHAVWYKGSVVVHWRQKSGIVLSISSQFGCNLFDIYNIPILVILSIIYISNLKSK